MNDLVRLKLPITCDCSHSFVINPVGVYLDTAIVCPACRKTNHLDQDTIDRVVDEYMDGIGELIENEEIYQKFMSVLIDAPEKEFAEITDDGMAQD